MWELTVEITQEHIDKGEPHSYCFCAFAKALQSYFRPTRGITVTARYSRLWVQEECLLTFWHSPELQYFIDSFDELGGKAKAKPGHYTVAIHPFNPY